MAKKIVKQGSLEAVWNPGEANPKQKLFYQSRTLFTAYGGAKGGGKTHAVRTKAIGGALSNPGIKILILRAHFREVDENHIQPICNAVLPLGIATYNDMKHRLSFENGSVITFGNWEGEESERTYNGLEYDWIFLDEATQFSERAFNFLGGCLRGVNDIPKRMYLTCNPGGIGHFWVKRLFIDKDYKTGCENPEENENPEDYTFIFATVEDNPQLLESSPLYLKNLSNMPEDIRRAYRYGDWDAVGGNYFKEFGKNHIVKPFVIPKHWKRYRSMDYGLDMFYMCWWAVDEDGRAWCYRTFERKDLIVSDAAKEALDHTLPAETIAATYAPPDMWSRMKDSGKTMAETFAKCGLPLIRSDNNRVQGHMHMKEAMAPVSVKDKFVKDKFKKDELPMLMFFDTCGSLLSDLKSIQSDDRDPNDCAKQPHEVTHSVDSVRYFAVSRIMTTETPEEPKDEDEDGPENYEEYMCGGEITEKYLAC